MLTVRFPSGLVVTYNTATQMRYVSAGIFELQTKENEWVASIQASSGAIVEIAPPCNVTSPLHETARAVTDLRQYIKRSMASRRRKR